LAGVNPLLSAKPLEHKTKLEMGTASISLVVVFNELVPDSATMSSLKPVTVTGSNVWALAKEQMRKRPVQKAVNNRMVANKEEIRITSKTLRQTSFLKF
jgi:hypothetical protein